MPKQTIDKLKPGARIAITSKDKVFEGIFLPSEHSAILTMKLDNGYNIGLDVASITDVKTLPVSKAKPKTAPEKVKTNSDLPTFSILHTGGTIASKVDYTTGAVTANFQPEELLAMFPELSTLANIKSRLVKQMMSENMRFAHYNILAKEVEAEIKKGVDGIIITHGTDTMHYSSAALSFALENLSIPVILVGAQRSSDRGSSDAALNLMSACYAMAETDFKGVAVCMHESMDDDSCLLISGTKARKMHTSRRDAFRPINSAPLARIDFPNKKIELLGAWKVHETLSKKQSKDKLSLKLFKEDIKVGLLKAHTNMYSEEFTAYKNFDGIVIEGTALGQLPNAVVDEYTKESGKILLALQSLTKAMPVVMASQCLYGRLDMNVYSEGRTNLDAGILGNYSDMTPETTFIKLAWLLSNHKKEISSLITKNLRGEISTRLEDNTFLV